MDREGQRFEKSLKDREGEQQQEDGGEIGEGDGDVGKLGIVVETAKGAVLFLGLVVMVMVEEPMGRADQHENHHQRQGQVSKAVSFRMHQNSSGTKTGLMIA
jgi:hypothetical protein